MKMPFLVYTASRMIAPAIMEAAMANPPSEGFEIQIPSEDRGGPLRFTGPGELRAFIE